MKQKGFTLIELLISITILFILMMMAYIPYEHYQKKAKLKLASREISQSFYEAKNMAVSGIKELKDADTYESENMSIWLYITTEDWKNNKVILFSYPYDIPEEEININSDTSIIKTNILQEWIKINNLSSNDLSYNNLLFFYRAINWEIKIFTLLSDSWQKDEINNDEISIIFSYMNATTSSLQKRLTYFKNTNIIDYD